MSSSSYSEKLKDPRWQKRRLKVMEYAHWRCQICGAKDNTLHCHHSYYTRGKLPWQYPDGAIICICDTCHEKIHGRKPSRLFERVVEEPPLSSEPVSPEVAREKFSALKKALECAAAPKMSLAEAVRRAST